MDNYETQKWARAGRGPGIYEAFLERVAQKKREIANYVDDQGGCFFLDDSVYLGLRDALARESLRHVTLDDYPDLPIWEAEERFIAWYERFRAAKYEKPFNAEDWRTDESRQGQPLSPMRFSEKEQIHEKWMKEHAWRMVREQCADFIRDQGGVFFLPNGDLVGLREALSEARGRDVSLSDYSDEEPIWKAELDFIDRYEFEHGGDLLHSDVAIALYEQKEREDYIARWGPEDEEAKVEARLKAEARKREFQAQYGDLLRDQAGIFIFHIGGEILGLRAAYEEIVGESAQDIDLNDLLFWALDEGGSMPLFHSRLVGATLHTVDGREFRIHVTASRGPDAKIMGMTMQLSGLRRYS